MLRKRDEQEDRQTLVDHEVRQSLDNDFGGNTEDGNIDAGGFVNDNQGIEGAVPFTPATLRDLEQNFHAVELPRTTQILLSEAPTDRLNFTYLVFYLLGTATMTPWNFFITAEDYWMYKFRNTTLNDTTDVAPELTPMQRSFTCDLTLTASIAGTTFLILNAVYGQRVSLKLKMLGTLCTILVFFIITTIFVEVNTDQWQEQFFVITLITVVIINICSAVLSGGIFGIAGLFPSEYMTALVSGQALGGIFTALAFILVLAFGAGPNTTAFVYFIIGSFLILFSILLYIAMTQESYFKYYLTGGDKYKVICATPTNSRSVDTGVALEPNLREVFTKIYVEAISVCILFATTLSVYPGVTVLMQSMDYGNGKAWNDVYFLPVVNYLFFNSGDYFGRILAGICERPHSNAHTALLMTLVRLAYLPFFLCANSNLHNFLPVLVHSDFSFILLMITFAVSNGYLANILLIMAPRAVKQHEKELASSIMAACLSLGLALGSILSMIFVQLL